MSSNDYFMSKPYPSQACLLPVKTLSYTIILSALEACPIAGMLNSCCKESCRTVEGLPPFHITMAYTTV